VRLVIELDATEPVLAGAVLSGSVCVRDRGATVRSLRLHLALVERTADFTDVVRHAGEIELATGALAPGARIPFSMQLPADAPPSIEAPPHASLAWELRAWTDVFGPDSSIVRLVRVVTRF
jgi:hypothetical protein